MKTLIKITAIVLVLAFISSCASSEAIDACVNPAESEGFLMGLVQGFIAPITFIISIFDSDIAMYAVNNSGFWYDLGFILGIGGFSGGILKGRRRKRRD